MKTINNRFSAKIKPQRVTYNLFLGLITTTTLLLSTFNLKANAQNLSVNNNQVTSYAEAVLAIEPVRQRAFSAIKKIMGGNIPQIVCNEPDSMNSLPGQARDIAVNYCKKSQDIVESKGLSIEEFNLITVEISRNNKLRQRVYDRLIQLQKKSVS